MAGSNIHNNVTEKDRQLVLEADGLGQIDWNDCSPSYDKKNTEEFFAAFKNKDRLPYVKTETGKKFYQELIKMAEKFLTNWRE
ncbi:MAG TPA: hypothetical protein VMD74_05035 [Candidatus Methylomirabilis sp.]|nr:hypothetical protein [Candidatus Methylomirabilis sp.]